jgi:hypothetical protein
LGKKEETFFIELLIGTKSFQIELSTVLFDCGKEEENFSVFGWTIQSELKLKSENKSRTFLIGKFSTPQKLLY